jgi:hypothetical protein
MLEGIIRPFQTPAGSPRIPIGVVVTKVPDPTIIDWGDPGSLPSPISDVVSVTLEKDEMKETQRKERKIRIENPDDPSQYVMVKRPEQMSFDKKHKPSTGGGGGGAGSTATVGSAGPLKKTSESSGVSDDGSQQAYNDFWKDASPEDLLLWGQGYPISKVEMYFRGGDPPNETNPDWPAG